MLRELQAAFARSLLGEDQAAAVAAIEPDGLAPEARLAIYRHHVLDTLTEVLAGAYPVVRRLVDERFFAYAADRYLRAEPPAGPCLFEYGETFPAFLGSFPPCRDVPYLADVARLEWAIYRAGQADDAEPLDPHTLREVAAQDYPRLAFFLDPSLSLVASPWPVDRIWRAHQPGHDDELPGCLSGGPVRLEVRRRGDDVVMRPLTLADYAFRLALSRGRPLEQAATAALPLDPAFDLATALHALLGDRQVVGFTLSSR